jgi:hypothetical protein
MTRSIKNDWRVSRELVAIQGVPPTPGCDALNATNGHFCAQGAAEALEQTLEFFRSAVEDQAPTIINPLTP